MAELGTNVHKLYSRILGQPQENVQKAVTTFVQEFETKRPSLLDKDSSTEMILGQAPDQLVSAKGSIGPGLSSTAEKVKSTAQELVKLQKIMTESQERKIVNNPVTAAKAAFQKDIEEAKEAFDQEMALRHADVIKQYVGSFVQQIDHY